MGYGGDEGVTKHGSRSAWRGVRDVAMAVEIDGGDGVR